MFVLWGELLGGNIVFDGEVMAVLHKVAKGPIKVVEPVEVGANGVVLLLQLVEVLHALVYLPLHHEHNALTE